LAKTSEKTNDSIIKCSDKDENCYWIIDPPNGPVSSGKCKNCGTEKEFKNSFEYNTWHGERPNAKDKAKGDKAKGDKAKGDKAKNQSKGAGK
jgi:hypothetical protein